MNLINHIIVFIKTRSKHPPQILKSAVNVYKLDVNDLLATGFDKQYIDEMFMLASQ